MGQIDRLKRRAEFLKVARSGRRTATPGIVLQVWRRDGADRDARNRGRRDVPGADDAARSLEAGRLIGVEALPGGRADTVADGLRTSLSPRTFAILRAHVTGIHRVPDDDTLAWMRFLAERVKLVVEPSGAVPLAALARNAAAHVGTTVAVVLSGGNVTLP